MTIVGTVVGAYFGYPQLGALIGSLVGGLLFPTQLPTVSGPRLSDITSTAASVGAPIPRGWGTFPASGCVIWQSDVREVIQKDEVGGKGSSTQTVETPTYFQDFAIGLNDGLIQGVRRIWANGKPLIDFRSRLTLADGSQESLAALFNRVIKSTVGFDSATLYLGDEEQLPDPTMEAALGVGNVSAFRGLAYIVFTNWKNKPEDGNRMPSTWKFELYTDGFDESLALDIYANEALYPWHTGVEDPVNALNLNTYGIDSVTYPYTTLGGAVAAYNLALGADPNQVQIDRLWGWYQNGDNDKIEPTLGNLTSFEGVACHVYLGRYDTDLARTVNGIYGCETVLTDVIHVISGTGGNFPAGNDHATYQTTPATDNAFGFPPGSQLGLCGGPLHAIWRLNDAVIYIQRAPVPPPDPCYQALPDTADFCLDSQGNLIPAGDWVLDSSTTYKVLQKYIVSGVNVASYPLGPARPLGHDDYDSQEFWEDAYTEAVVRGQIASGLTYGIHYPATQAYAYKKAASGRAILTNRIPITDIIRDLSIEAGATETQLDLTDLADITIMGYVRTRPMAARAAIDPLRSFGFFDCYESNGKIRYVRRGKGTVATIPDDELGAAIVGGENPSRITTRKVMDYDLPRQVRIHYLSPSRDYEPGQQDSPTRIETDAVNDMDFELPIVLTDDEAAQIAGVLWADYWASRWVHEAYVDARYHFLEPTDCISIPVDGQYERLRIVKITDSLPSVRKLEMLRDDDGTYISYAVAEVPPLVIPPLAVIAPIELILLDLPPLRDQDDDAGLYAAARVTAVDSTFQGAAVMRSSDGGSNYSTIANIGSETTMGLLIGDVDVGPTSIWDDGTEIFIQLQTGTLENRTADAVLAGANAAAIGAHGHWEILQFRNWRQVSSTIVAISGLLRGRRGTEHNVGLALDGEKFVMLSTGTVTRVPLDLALVNKEMLYKGVTAGLPIDSATAATFTGAGEALRPFSPGRVRADRNVGGDFLISWIRRGRFGQTLQSGTDVALSEEVEDYEVEILRDGVAARTISISEENATYTLNQQIIDFGAQQSSIDVRVYQISARVGRGSFAEATL